MQGGQRCNIVSDKNQLRLDDFLGAVSDAVHLPYPRLWVAGFQCLRHALSGCVLFYQPKKEFLRLLLDVCEVPVQRPGGQQVEIQYPMMLLQINSPPLAVNADGAFFFGR